MTTLANYRDALRAALDQDLDDDDLSSLDQRAPLLAYIALILGGSGGATAAEILNAIQTASNLNDIETLLAAVRDRLVSGGPALNLGAVNGQTQRVVDAASLFTTTNVGNYDGTFTASGTSALAAQNIQQLDMQGVGRSEFSLSVTATNSVAAVGAGRTMTFYYAVSPDTGITNPTEFTRFTVLPEIALTNTLNAVNRLTSARFLSEARYLYVWHDRTAFNASAVITPRVRVNSL